MTIEAGKSGAHVSGVREGLEKAAVYLEARALESDQLEKLHAEDGYEFGAYLARGAARERRDFASDFRAIASNLAPSPAVGIVGELREAVAGWQVSAPERGVVRLSKAAKRAADEIERFQGEVDHLTDEVSDLQQEPWPKWAELILARMREYGVVDRFDDEIDLPQVFDEWVEGFEGEVLREASSEATARAEAAEAREAKLREVLEPFIEAAKTLRADDTDTMRPAIVQTIHFRRLLAALTTKEG